MGSGKIIDNKPPGSDNNGMIVKEETVKIPIPAGVVDEMQLKVSGKGNDAPGDGISGDLLVVINEIPHNELQRDCLLYTSPSPRDKRQSRMPSSA